MSKPKKLKIENVERSLGLQSIQFQLKFLEGKVLTIVDAVIPSPGIDYVTTSSTIGYVAPFSQNKAVKDLIKSAFSEQLSWISQLCYPQMAMRSEDQLKAEGVDIQKVISEAEEVE